MSLTHQEAERLAARLQPAAIDRDRACGGCGYNLRGLAISGLCPECGLPIAAVTNVDEPLSQMPLEVIRRFRAASWAASLCVIGAAGVMIVSPALPTRERAMLLLVLAFAWTASAWLLTPSLTIHHAVVRGFSDRSRLRLTTRYLQVGWIAAAFLAVLQSSVPVGQVGLTQMLWVVFGLCVCTGLAGLVTLGIMLERLSEWARDDFAQKCFNWAVWSIPLTTVGLLVDMPFGVCGVGIGVLWGMFWAACVLSFPVGVLSLSRSITYSVFHAHELIARQKRQRRRDDRWRAGIASRNR